MATTAKKFLVRKNCEYSLLVEAETEDEAHVVADTADLEEWQQAWSEQEVEASDE